MNQISGIGIFKERQQFRLDVDSNLWWLVFMCYYKRRVIHIPHLNFASALIPFLALHHKTISSSTHFKKQASHFNWGDKG